MVRPGQGGSSAVGANVLVNQCGLYTHFIIVYIPNFLKAALNPAIYHSAVTILFRITFKEILNNTQQIHPVHSPGREDGTSS